MSHSTTTLDRIVHLYDQERTLLNHDLDDWQAAREVRTICADIRAKLDRLWHDRRAELTFQIAGPPRYLGGGGERDQKRQIAYGIQPLPSGGDT